MAVNVAGITDPDGDPTTITIDRFFQDEAVDANGSGNTSPDGNGGSCSGEVLISVPKSQGKKGAAVGDGALFNSTTVAP